MSFYMRQRPAKPEAKTPAPLNWRRGLLRGWAVLSAAWMMGWIIYLIMRTLENGFKASDALVTPVLLVGPPVALMIFGLAAIWALRGFIVDPMFDDED